MDFRVTVTIDETTLAALSRSGSRLYAYMAVGRTDPATRPILWAQASCSANTTIAWSDSWTAFVSPTSVAGGNHIVIGSSASIELGQTLEVDEYGSGIVKSSGTAGVISVRNTANTPRTAGVACTPTVNGNGGTDSVPFCVFPLYGNVLQTILPLRTVLLRFTDEPTPVGTILGGSASAQAQATYLSTSAYLIDFDPSGVGRAVSFDINTGWANGNAGWARAIAAGTPLEQVLVRQ